MTDASTKTAAGKGVGTIDTRKYFGTYDRRPLRVKDDHLRRVLAGEDFLLFDGAMGTQLQARGLAAGEVPELLCLTNPQQITQIHQAYVQAGSEVVTTNTFGASAPKLGSAATVEEVFSAAVACAKASGARYVAADIGPTGSLLEPMGTLPFDDAYELFAQQVRAADAAGADLFIIETMADLAEAKAAVLAAKECSDLPIFCTMTFDEDGRTFLGTTPEVAAKTLSSLGASVVGINCSLGPKDVAPLVKRMLPWSSVPVMAQANAGLPHVEDGITLYDIKPKEYCEAVRDMLDAGVTVVGGCCGTTPQYIAGERDLLAGRTPAARDVCRDFAVTSSQRLVSLPAGHVGVIGERINPTGKRRMKEALRSGNYDYVMQEAISQTDAGAQVLDVNAGLPEIDESATLRRLMADLQGVTNLPLQVDSAVPATIEAAVRSYPGKPIINSTNGKQETMDAVIPIAAHYGCALVALTIDEKGIPQTAEGRLGVARRIVAATDTAGIPRQDVVVDCLCMAASTDQSAPRQILDGISLVKRELPGVRTVLGVSNISFGLPFRPLVNATFLAAAFAAGLDLCIINPCQQRMMDVVNSWRVLSGEDQSAQAYVAGYATRSDRAPAPSAASAGGLGAEGAPAECPPRAADGAGSRDAASSDPADQARAMVLAGRKGPMPGLVSAVLAQHDVMYAINQVLIPALDEVGVRFEKGTFFLPQLMASAEAAKAGFNTIKEANDAAGVEVASKGKVAVCTVKGDIHDIGKNIVKMLLENYGYDVIDLGRDVDPQVVVDTVVREHLRVVGLSALMTATVPAMADTIELLRQQAPWCKVIVGGAVLNPEYAKMVGADYYAKDAAESARIVGEILGQ
ncbi:homocysteine S-methyltransferase family protein [Parafannyhessea umbonata]|uniref:Methionine synthase n=1 Tax=Parafannyhessea umbonata TaxID=604330 RepID=A0A1H1KSX8_9ACTN|nr:homocysteine S-methyltransferase family protein [Parafannyhessea umbonata]SDR65356.1 5-methyltetrahydrofolate--homocysteine methyltransferase [Parafannyhessea umbonata]